MHSIRTGPRPNKSLQATPTSAAVFRCAVTPAACAAVAPAPLGNGVGTACLDVRLLDAHFMKTSLVVVLAFILVGCESSRRSASLTTEQATTIAMRLANDKASTLFQHQPFVAGQPAQFVADHWLWVARQGFGHSDIQATVELAADGTTNHVDIQLSDSQNLPLHY